MKRLAVTISLVAASALTLTSPASADQRSFVWTYEYMTLPRGQWELEHYLTLSSSDLRHPAGKVATEHQIELEVGMTDRFDFAIYQKFSQSPGGSLTYKGFKLRERYRFAEEGKLIVDPLIYAEYEGVPDFSSHAIELKVILARKFGALGLSVNPVLEIEVEDREWEFVPKYALGANYRLNKRLTIGIESKGSEDGYYIGPVIAHGGEHAWVALGSGFLVGGGDDGSSAFQIRMLLGIQPWSPDADHR